MPWLTFFYESLWRAYVGWALVLGLLTILETLAPHEPVPWRARWRGLLFWAAWIPASVGWTTLLFGGWDWLGVQALFALPVDRAFAWGGLWPSLVAPVLGVIAGDFFAYWYHRLQHARLWRFHAVHHSIEQMSAVNSYHHISETLFTLAVTTLPMKLLGVDYGTAVPLLVFLTWLQAVYLHSPTKLSLGRLRWIFADNRYHRIHHSVQRAHFDHNFGILLTWWDRLFGTHHDPLPGEWPSVGLEHVAEPKTLREWLDLPFRYSEDAGEAPRPRRSQWTKRATTSR